MLYTPLLVVAEAPRTKKDSLSEVWSIFHRRVYSGRLFSFGRQQAGAQIKIQDLKPNRGVTERRLLQFAARFSRFYLQQLMLTWSEEMWDRCKITHSNKFKRDRKTGDNSKGELTCFHIFINSVTAVSWGSFVYWQQCEGCLWDVVSRAFDDLCMCACTWACMYVCLVVLFLVLVFSGVCVITRGG